MLLAAVRTLRCTPHQALHDVPLPQVFALTACDAWGQGMEPAGETYEDRDISAAIARLTGRAV